MKKITSIDDVFTSIDDVFNNDNKIHQQLVHQVGEIANLTVIPSENYKDGKYGFVIMHGDQEMNASLVVLEPVSETIDHTSCEDFMELLQRYLNDDIYLFKADDPMRLRLGYVAVRNSGLIHHTICLSLYKKYIAFKKGMLHR